MPTVPSPTCRRALRAAADAVAAVGEGLARAQRRLRPQEIRRKGRGDFVTDADLRAEAQLRERLLGCLPTAGFLGEEGREHGLDREFVWVVDPIDGTSNFANGLSQYAVAAALLQRGAPVAAAIWSAPEQVVYTALRGGGARRAGRRLRTPRGRLDDGALIGCQWHRGRGDFAFLRRLQQGGGRLRNFGCTVTQLLDVAAGRLHANVQTQGRIWDFAAAALVLLEAGGRFTDWRGRGLFPLPRLDRGDTAKVGSAPGIHRRLVGWLDGVVVPPG